MRYSDLLLAGWSGDSNFGEGRDFSNLSRPAQLPVQCVLGLFPGYKVVGGVAFTTHVFQRLG